MVFTLGAAPITLKVILVEGADFVSTLRRKDGADWPAVDLILEFPGVDPVVEWTAVLTDDLASWNVDQTDVDALLDQNPRKVKLWYVEGDLRLLWAQGEVDKRRA